MLETAQKPKVLPEWMWPALAIALGLTGALSAVLAPVPSQAPHEELDTRLAPPPLLAPSAPQAVTAPQPVPDAQIPAAAPIEPPPAALHPALVAEAPVEVPIEVPIEVPTPKITARFLAPPAPPAERERTKPSRRPEKPVLAPKPAKVAPSTPTSDIPQAKQPSEPAAVRSAAPVAPAESRPFRLLAVSGETVWAAAGDKATVTAQVGEDLPAGMGRVVAVFRNGARFERNGKKFDLTVE